MLPDQLLEAISIAYEKLEKGYGGEEVSFAVRSSATAEDLADASFGGPARNATECKWVSTN